jgi:hypothetical protein
MVLAKGTDAKYDYALQISLQERRYQTKLHILMKLDFSFIFLLALRAIVDPHVKL